MRIRYFHIGCLVLMLVAVSIGITFLNPLRLQSEDELERKLLTETPIGTSRDEVREIVLKHGWKIYEDRTLKGINSNETIGSEIDASLGSYTHLSFPMPIPLSGLVWAHWHFDRNDNLEWVEAKKEVNGT